MLTFSAAQMTSFQTRWQIEQLQAQLPNVLSQLAENHPTFYQQNKARQHQYHGTKLIEQAVLHGYTCLEHIQQLLDMEYQTRLNIYAENPIRLLYQADWLRPQDRINAIDYLCSLKAAETIHPYRIHLATYGLLDDYSREQRCQDISTLATLNNSDGACAACLHLHQQGFYHALLKQALQTTPGWESWDSDWQQACIGIENQRYQRRIRLQAASDLHATTVQIMQNEPTKNEEDLPVLTLLIPNSLNDEQHARLHDILHAWAAELLPAAALQKRFLPTVDKEMSTPNQPTT